MLFVATGHGFGAAFTRTADGARAALAAQVGLHAVAWPTATPLRVRAGIHIGTADERDGNYFGPAVGRTARIMGCASGGQVHVSAAAAQLLRKPGADFALVDRGTRELKGVKAQSGCSSW